jgi:hypothetical protein
MELCQSVVTGDDVDAKIVTATGVQTCSEVISEWVLLLLQRSCLTGSHSFDTTN